MTPIIINNNTSYFTPAVIFVFVFLAIIIYLAITSRIERNFRKKIKKAKLMIEEGHKKALVGRKDDGLYQETKKLRSEPEDTKSWEDMVMEGYNEKT